MTISYFVRYQKLGAALDSFDEYYCRQHADILAQFPGVRSLAVRRHGIRSRRRRIRPTFWRR